MSIPVRVGEQIGIVVVLKVWYDGQHILAECHCECGTEFRRRTNGLRRTRGNLKVSCGCLKRALAREHIARVRARRSAESMAESVRTLRERSAKDPSPWQIAEECLQVHMDAGREPPEQLMVMLEEFRKSAVHE